MQQRLFWKLHSINALCWAFLCVNDNNEVDLIVPQIMRFEFKSKNSSKKRTNHI